MGWDAFGFPAENAAFEHGVHPATWTKDNIAYMRSQLRRMGFSYDWSREVTCCEPEYYRWNQWFFLKMLERGLASRKTAPVNWCERCQSVLSNEQAEGGVCWRHGDTPVVQRELEQWFLRITNYVEELLRDIDSLPGWPERVRTMQRNWIGKSVGADVEFALVQGGSLRIFTTRPDTLFGATFMVLAPEHPLTLRLAAGTPQEQAVAAFVERMRRADRAVRVDATAEKEGVFTGAYAVNPLTRERIPIWVANFILMEYGTGAIMAVPAHDQRDLEMATTYHLPIRVVIQPDGEALSDGGRLKAAYDGEGRMVNSGQFTGMPSGEGVLAVCEYLEEHGVGKRAVNYRIRDWLISRQRYWGTPIPVLYCEACGVDVDPFLQIAPDSSLAAIMISGQDQPGVIEMWTVPVTGGPAVKINGMLVSGGNVDGERFSLDSRTVLYIADQDTDGVWELYAAPATGGRKTKSNGPLGATGSVTQFYWSHDGSRVVYQAHQYSGGPEEIYSAPITGGSFIKLSGALPSGASVSTLRVSLSTPWAVYSADQDALGVVELYSVPTTGGRPRKLNGPLVLFKNQRQIHTRQHIAVHHHGSG